MNSTPPSRVSAMRQSSISNPVLEKSLDRLSRYGHRRNPTEAPETPATEWARLKSDFTEPGGAMVPNFDDLPADAQAAARHYLDLKREADQLLSACEAAHGDILRHGLDVARVDDYAVVRDAYEDKVEEFGAARLVVSEALAET